MAHRWNDADGRNPEVLGGKKPVKIQFIHHKSHVD